MYGGFPTERVSQAADTGLPYYTAKDMIMMINSSSLEVCLLPLHCAQHVPLHVPSAVHLFQRLLCFMHTHFSSGMLQGVCKQGAHFRITHVPNTSCHAHESNVQPGIDSRAVLCCRA